MTKLHNVAILLPQMNLHHLLALLDRMPGFDRLARELAGTGNRSLRLPEAARPYFVAALHARLHRPVLVVTPSAERAREFYEQLRQWSHAPHAVHRFAETDLFPYEDLPAYGDSWQDRLQALVALRNAREGHGVAPIIVTCSLGFVGTTTHPAHLATSTTVLKTGDSYDPAALTRHCVDLGYHRDDPVELPGSFTQRGGIIDIYPPSSPAPTRIEFFGREIESIRGFDAESQKSTGQLRALAITPAHEQRDDASILDHFGPPALVVMEDPDRVQDQVGRLAAEALNADAAHPGGQQASGSQAWALSWHDITSALTSHTSLLLQEWDTVSDQFGSSFTSYREYSGNLDTFADDARGTLNQHSRVVIVSHQADRLSELLEQRGLSVPPVSTLEHLPPGGSLVLLRGILSGGWSLTGELHLVTDRELFGFTKRPRPGRTSPVPRQQAEPQLKPGDYVTHTDHGIGKFERLTTMKSGGMDREYLVLTYAGGDRLYVPTEQIGRVARYVGSDDQAPSLSRLGTQEWVKTKARVRRAVTDVARDLLELHAARELAEGFPFSPDTLWQQELEASFPYVETPDQSQAVIAVKQDMETPRPMDRLICGDVGYGKTEVAVRAAFKAVMEGKQVAVLVPTTVLAQQHYGTFRERLQTFPVHIGMLSRFSSREEERDTLEALSNGSMDVCIGTHRLLQKDVRFSDLGLLIVDEEQHFGVLQKEKLKQLRKELDVLTLSATPIPRTLHMSLSGIKEMTTMETPPEDRLSIKTHVGVYDERLVRHAILRELDRNGQVFFIHNRVQDIASAARQVQQLVPDARIGIAHGQMPEESLERTMGDFVSGSYDVLITTTIIQLGLDMPNVNTLLVDQADKLGLAQLYQLRGRIGRGPHQAYAYFLFRREGGLTSQAHKRLKTIFEATELGAGFGIAMRDLEIRGAGNLLGARQSGHIAAVGFELYNQMLADAVERLRSQQERPERPAARARVPTISLPLPAYLPDDYVPHVNTRLRLYRRIADAACVEDIRQIEDELVDRFGELPLAGANLLYLTRIKLLAAATGVRSISMQGKHVVLRPENMDGLRPPDEYRHAVRFGPTQIRLDTRVLGKRWQQALESLLASAASSPEDLGRPTAPAPSTSPSTPYPVGASSPGPRERSQP
ncbi:MAG: transcription-repair coupling factor [Chloroflexota bacterium]